MKKRSIARGNRRIDGEQSEAISRQMYCQRQSRAEGAMSEAIKSRRNTVRGNQGRKEPCQKQSRTEVAMSEAIKGRKGSVRGNQGAEGSISEAINGRRPVRGNQEQKDPCQRQSRAKKPCQRQSIGRGSARGNQWEFGALSEAVYKHTEHCQKKWV
jgi:hypothetical protein